MAKNGVALRVGIAEARDGGPPEVVRETLWRHPDLPDRAEIAETMGRFYAARGRAIGPRVVQARIEAGEEVLSSYEAAANAEPTLAANEVWGWVMGAAVSGKLGPLG